MPVTGVRKVVNYNVVSDLTYGKWRKESQEEWYIHNTSLDTAWQAIDKNRKNNSKSENFDWKPFWDWYTLLNLLYWIELLTFRRIDEICQGKNSAFFMMFLF